MRPCRKNSFTKTIIKTGLAALLLLLSISCKKESNAIQFSSINGESSISDDITDINALSVKIGAQVWMNKNLNVTRYRNGDQIPQVRNAAKWATLTTGAWCWLNNDSTNGSIYGRLYNWYAVNDPRGLAPAGWHIPSDSEWTTLTTFLGGVSVAGGKMKSTGTIKTGTGLWRAPNTGATNSSGFTGLPGGWRLDDGSFHTFGGSDVGYGVGHWWTATVNDNSHSSHSAWKRVLRYDSASILVLSDGERDGCSVRCVKD
jgi:uncharacterized protein (TIGR02145 family)